MCAVQGLTHLANGWGCVVRFFKIQNLVHIRWIRCSGDGAGESELEKYLLWLVIRSENDGHSQ